MNKGVGRLLAAVLLSAAGPLVAGAQTWNTVDRPEPGSVEAIAAESSDPAFVSSWVAYVPESDAVPSPGDFLGHIAGAAGDLPDSGLIYSYLRALAAATGRVHLEVIGETEEGREILLLAIADEDGIADLERLKGVTAALADPRVTTPEQSEALIAAGRPFYYFNGAIHADESTSPDMLMELAYRLAVSEEPMIRRIRSELVVLINPVANPDGRDKMSDWFYRFHQGKTDYDTLARQSPPYWGKYVFVDANRDAHQLDLATTQAVARMFFAYHPTVVHDLHEAIPLLQTWNGTGPYNPNLDPVVLAEFLEMSFHEMSTMSALGMPGVWTWEFGEGFGHHYTDSVGMNHNAIGRGYETFGNAVPLKVTRKLSAGAVTREWYRPWPPPARELVWSHRDGVNYGQTGALAILDYSARQADQMLRNFYQKSFNSWHQGVEGNPFAFVIPADQPDRRRVAQMVNRLLSQGIEVGRATAGFEVAEGSFSTGDFVVQLDQPYRNYAVDLLLPQEFPANAQYEPYDDTSWALPVHYGVTTVRVDDGAVRRVELQPVAAPVHVAGSVAGAGPVYLLNDSGQEALLAARYRLAGFEVQIAEQAFEAGGRSFAAGSWILPAQEGLGAKLAAAAEELALDFVSVGSVPEVARHDAPAPRVGVWVPWADTDMIGWIRLILDQEAIPYTYLRDEEIRAGNLRDLVDVVVYGTVDLELEGQIHGIEPVAGPMPFRNTPEFPSLGSPAASDDITGGIGWAGMANLEAFVRDGGLLATLGRGTAIALESGLVRNVRAAALPGVTTPGTHLRARFLQPDHPLAYGYPDVATVFRSPYGFYDVPRRWLRMSYCTSCLNGPVDASAVVLQWGTRMTSTGDDEGGGGGPTEPILVSGGGQNLGAIEGRPAIFDLPVGKGHVLAYNFNPMHRDMNHADHRLLWNGLLNWKHILER